MEDKPMKCLKNTKTGNIVRVTDEQANQMVGSSWSYVSKTEWKNLKKAIEKVEETNVAVSADKTEKINTSKVKVKKVNKK